MAHEVLTFEGSRPRTVSAAIFCPQQSYLMGQTDFCPSLVMYLMDQTDFCPTLVTYLMGQTDFCPSLVTYLMGQFFIGNIYIMGQLFIGNIPHWPALHW